MRALSPAEILAVWEAGRPQHELDRALTLLLAAASPSPGETTTVVSREELAELPVGERDARLLRLRALTLGPMAEGFAECPGCGQPVEFSVDTTALASPSEHGESTTKVHELAAANGHPAIRFRLPTSRDLAEIVTAPDAAHGLQRLVGRCVLTATAAVNGDGADESASSSRETGLSPETVEAVSLAMAEADPRAEIILALECPGCRHRWPMLFEVISFFWRELAVRAQRLLREVDALARAYGWSEREILSLSARRRQSYLELIEEAEGLSP